MDKAMILLYARLREVEEILDRTDPSENPPYRNERKRLNYERDQLREKLAGEDLLSSVDGLKPYQIHYRYLNRDQKRQFKMNKCIRSIFSDNLINN